MLNYLLTLEANLGNFGVERSFRSLSSRGIVGRWVDHSAYNRIKNAIQDRTSDLLTGIQPKRF